MNPKPLQSRHTRLASLRGGLEVLVGRRPLPSPRWSMQSSWPNRSSALPVTLHLPLQTRFLVRPQLLTHRYPLPMGRDIPRSLLVA